MLCVLAPGKSLLVPARLALPGLCIQVSLARLGAGFGSALADIIPNRIPAHPRGAFISVGLPPLR